MDTCIVSKKIYTGRELAPMLGVSVSHLYQMALEERVPCVRIGTRVRFPGWKILEWIDHETAGAITGDGL